MLFKLLLSDGDYAGLTRTEFANNEDILKRIAEAFLAENTGGDAYIIRQGFTEDGLAYNAETVWTKFGKDVELAELAMDEDVEDEYYEE